MSGGISSLAFSALQGVVAGASGSSGIQLPTMFDAQSQPDVAASWLWTANITGIGGPGSSLPAMPAFNNIPLADLTVPFEGFTVDPKFKGGFTYNYPKFVNVTPVIMTFHELQTFITTGFFAAWKSRIFNNVTGDYYLPKDYYGKIIATLFDTMGIPALEVTMTGCWPDKFTDLTLTTSASGALQVSANLSINRSNVTYISATLLDSPLAKIISGNPIASLSSLGGIGLASLTSSAAQYLGKSLSGVGSVAENALGNLF